MIQILSIKSSKAFGSLTPAAKSVVGIDYEISVPEFTPKKQQTQHCSDPTSQSQCDRRDHGVQQRDDALAILVSSAQEELDRLFNIVRRISCEIFLCDRNGCVIDYRGDPKKADQSALTLDQGELSGKAKGRAELPISERRAVCVSHAHNFEEDSVLSYSETQVHDSCGEPLALLKLRSAHPDRYEQSRLMVSTIIQSAARAIEERLFRERFRREWIVAVIPRHEPDAGMLLAVDRSYRIVGADRQARVFLSSNGRNLQHSLEFWAVFDGSATLFRHRSRGDVPCDLAPCGMNETWPSLLTPPEHPVAWCSFELRTWHSRPRLDNCGKFRQPAPSGQSRGGLSPMMSRRVTEYIDAHLTEKVTLATLATVAGSSKYHFARAFRESEGVPPHRYLVQRRVKKAQDLLINTDLPLSQIALTVGFADQGHFTVQFRRCLGVTPGTFRRLRATP